MITKTIGTIIVVFLCILMFPVAIALVGGVFGIAAGVIGAVFGAIVAVIGAIFGAIFGVFGWIFDRIFGWGDFHWPFGFFHCNFFTLAAIVLVIALVARSSRMKRQ
jgi:hypothetical protein